MSTTDLAMSHHTLHPDPDPAMVHRDWKVTLGIRCPSHHLRRLLKPSPSGVQQKIVKKWRRISLYVDLSHLFVTIATDNPKYFCLGTVDLSNL
jgi:hypothetical protein